MGPAGAFHAAAKCGDSGPRLAAWGRVAQGSLDGEAVTGVLGADADCGSLLAGVVVSLSEGVGKFDQPDMDSGNVESTLTTVSPYARFRFPF